MTDLTALARASLDEVGRVIAALPPEGPARFLEEVRRARTLALYGVGREGLAVRALAMRLYHLGLNAHVVGDMTVRPLGAGDLLICSAGPGGFSTVNGLLGVAREAGARTLVFTAQEGGGAARLADTVVLIPAQTMANDGAPGSDRRISALPMGSLYELSLWLLGDLLVEALRGALGESPASMRARHTNLE